MYVSGYKVCKYQAVDADLDGWSVVVDGPPSEFGLVIAIGPGVKLTLDDSRGSCLKSDELHLLMSLWPVSAGAEDCTFKTPGRQQIRRTCRIKRRYYYPQPTWVNPKPLCRRKDYLEQGL